ncbi:hypothetical protein Droror1_Dr00002024 [Drosera rotundifolia]
MSFDLMLKPMCRKCGRSNDLYGSNCKHMTLCLKCGKELAEARAKCLDCGVVLTRLIREYNVRASAGNEKNYFIGRFGSGLPTFGTKKKNSDTRWTLQKEGLQGRQVTDTLKDKYKNKPWLLEDDAGQFQYHGHLEGSQSAKYYLLLMQGREFVAIPAGSLYNFNKVAQYRQLTIEEAEEMLKNRSKHTEQSRWIMKTSNPGLAAALGGNDKPSSKNNGHGGGPRRKKSTEDGEGNDPNRGEDDRARGQKKGGDDFDDEAPVEDFDADDDIEKGDDWEHEEIFTDDDEAVALDPEEREDLGPEVPAPPEIKDDEDEEEGEEADGNDGGLSKSGKELKKLLGRANGLNDSDAEDDEDDEDDDEDRSSPVLAPKVKDAVKEEPAENKPVLGGSAKGTPSPSKSAKGKRKTNGDDTKSPNTIPAKKVKLENELKPVKEEAKPSVSTKGVPSTSSNPPAPTQGPVAEDEIRAVLLQRASVTTQELVSVFKARLRSREDKNAFAETLKRISKIQKTANGQNYIVLRER